MPCRWVTNWTLRSCLNSYNQKQVRTYQPRRSRAKTSSTIIIIIRNSNNNNNSHITFSILTFSKINFTQINMMILKFHSPQVAIKTEHSLLRSLLILILTVRAMTVLSTQTCRLISTISSIRLSRCQITRRVVARAVVRAWIALRVTLKKTHSGRSYLRAVI